MYSPVIMPIQTNLNNSSELTNTIVNSIWPKTPQQNKFRQMMQDKHSTNKKRRHDQMKQNFSKTPNSSFSSKTAQIQSSPFYAGAKFSEAPLATLLPKPPTEWINNQTDLSKLNSLNNLFQSAAVVDAKKVIEETIEILEIKEDVKAKLDQTVSSTKYYEKNKNKTALNSTITSPSASSFEYNFRNTRRNTPQCQTKCINSNRYSSFSRQNYQKIAAVN